MSIATTFVLLTAVVGVQDEGVTRKFIASGATARSGGGYRPIRANMTDKDDGVKKAPEGLKNPKYGKIRLGGKTFGFILDEVEGKHKLYVDTNGDGDLTNDPKSTWISVKSRGLTMYRGKTQVDLGGGKLGSVNLYRFDPNDPRRRQLKSTILYYTDFGYQISLKLDGKEFKTFVSGDLGAGTRLWIDRDGNKKRSSKMETVFVGRPFNFTGTTYLLSVKDGSAKLAKAAKELPMTPLPPDLRIGKKALPFSQVSIDGKKIDFPKSYAGKIVMLDFWATWCGPCIRELPNVTKAYGTWHDKGFDILSISFDNANMTAKLQAFAKKHEMNWDHLYEGKGWNTSLGTMYDVSGIPFVLLVDGDTGEILGTSRELRGPGLTDFIGKVLEKKNAKKKNKTE